MGFFVLLIPVIILLLIILAIALLFSKYKIFSLIIFSLVSIVNYYTELFAFSFVKFHGNEEHAIKILTFNIHAAGDDFSCRYEDLSKLIASTNSDIVLLIEFSTQYDNFDIKFDSIMSKHFPYSSVGLFLPDDMVLYSKHPIKSVDSMGISGKSSFPLFHLNVYNKELSLLGCHFASNNYVDSVRRMEIDSVKTKMDLYTYMKAINKGYEQRRFQVNNLCAKLNYAPQASIDKMIILGDFNDVGGSYVIKKIEKLGLKDAWWVNGFGLGGTRNVGFYPFRLDHILYGSELLIKNVEVIDSHKLSDHNAVSATFCLN